MSIKASSEYSSISPAIALAAALARAAALKDVPADR
jgi:hypothetical protein